jgi:hypothetical protein
VTVIVVQLYNVGTDRHLDHAQVAGRREAVGRDPGGLPVRLRQPVTQVEKHGRCLFVERVRSRDDDIDFVGLGSERLPYRSQALRGFE